MFPKSPVKGTFSGDKVRPVLTFTLEIGRELLSKGRNKPTRIPNLNNTEGGGGGFLYSNEFCDTKCCNRDKKISAWVTTRRLNYWNMYSNTTK